MSAWLLLLFAVPGGVDGAGILKDPIKEPRHVAHDELQRSRFLLLVLALAFLLLLLRQMLAHLDIFSYIQVHTVVMLIIPSHNNTVQYSSLSIVII